MQRAVRILAILATILIAEHVDSGEAPKDLTNSIGMKFRMIPAGEFRMGNAASTDRHKERIIKPFYLGVTEVTQQQYAKVMSINPSSFSKTGEDADKVKGLETSHFPVERVNWNDAVEFCTKLSSRDGRTYRLPTEDEWRYACLAGRVAEYSFGNDETQLSNFAWFGDNSGRTSIDSWKLRESGEDVSYQLESNCCQPHPVAKKKPNAWGLFDMHGNVSEWCRKVDDAADLLQVNCGGCWASNSKYCKLSTRFERDRLDRSYVVGFRVVLEISSDKND